MTKTVTRTYYDRDENVPELIVCASCIMKDKKTRASYMINGARHFDMLMHEQIKALEKNIHIELVPDEQGFITNKGRFVDRKEALEIAKANNQIIRDIGYKPKELYSEMLY